MYHISRLLISFISRIRIFHFCAKTHLTDKDIISSPDCECGHESQDLDHIFFNYPIYKEAADHLTLDLFYNGFSPPFEVAEISFS